jgi:hypothetical protein
VLGHRPLEALDAVGDRRDREVLLEQEHRSRPALDHVIGRCEGTAAVVGRHEVSREVAELPVDDDDGHSDALHLLPRIGLALHGHDDHPVEPRVDDGVRRRALPIDGLVGEQEHDGVSGCRRRQLDLADELGVERIRHVRDDEPDHLARPEHERARVGVGYVADPLRLRPDERTRRLAHPWLAAQRSRDGVR